MIVYVSRVRDQRGLRSYLEHYGESVRRDVVFLSIEELYRLQVAPPGTYVFAGHDQWTKDHLAIATQLADQVKGHCPILNDPGDVIGRFQYLETLYKAGLNTYQAYRADQLPTSIQYPVFVRIERDHEGPRTGLIESREELQSVLLAACSGGLPLADLLVVEFIDVCEDGEFHKYSYTRFGDLLDPRHLVFSSNWSVKVPNALKGAVSTEAQVRKETEFCETQPHREQILRAFDLAGVGYGRIDYSLDRDGRIQVWEVNTAPVPMSEPDRIPEARKELNASRAPHVLAAFRHLAGLSDRREAIPIEIRLPQGSA